MTGAVMERLPTKASTPVLWPRSDTQAATHASTPSIADVAAPLERLTDVIQSLLKAEDILGRWFRAWAARSEAEELQERTTTLNLLRNPASPPLELNPPSAWTAAQHLRSWLGVTFQELSAMTGVGTSTFHSWSRVGVSPRPSKARNLWRLYTLAQSLQGRLGVEDAVIWLQSGSPTRISMLLGGHLGEVESLARQSVLRPVLVESNAFAAARVEDRLGDDYQILRPSTERAPAKKAARPIKKGRRASS